MLSLWSVKAAQKELLNKKNKSSLQMMFNPKIYPAIENNILSFLTPYEFSYLLAVNSFWQQQVMRFSIIHPEGFFYVLFYNATKLAKFLRQHAIFENQFPLFALPAVHFLKMHRLYCCVETTLLVNNDNYANILARDTMEIWLDYFKAIVSDPQRFSIKPDFCNRAVKSLLLFSLASITLYAYSAIQKKLFMKKMAWRDQVYQQIDLYLKTNTRYGYTKADYFLFKQTKLSVGIYGATTPAYSWCYVYKHINFAPIKRDTSSSLCQWDNSYFSGDEGTIVNCYEKEGQDIPFAYVSSSPELHRYLAQCATVNKALGVVDGSWFVWDHMDQDFTPYQTTLIDNCKAIPLAFSMMFFIAWFIFGGVKSAKNAYRNYVLAHFYRGSKKQINKLQKLMLWQNQLEENYIAAESKANVEIKLDL